jgi:Flp pilus assembly protein TadG
MDRSVRRAAASLRSLLQRNRVAGDEQVGDLEDNESGSSLVELAVTLPVLMLFVFGFIEICLICYTKNMISEAAREGTEYAIVRSSSCMTNNGTTSTSCTVTATQVNTYVSGLALPNITRGTMTPTTTFIEPSGGTGPGNVDDNYVNVTVTYALPTIIPFFHNNTITLTSSSQMTLIH